MKENGTALKFASIRLQNHKELLFTAVENGYKNYFPDPEAYENDIEIYWKFYKNYHKRIKQLPTNMNFTFSEN